MKDLHSIILNKSEEIIAQLIKIRSHLHQYPELSFVEYKTSEFIKKQLDTKSISYSSDWCGTGIVGTIGKSKSHKVIALRADMDALPIQEKNDVVYKSQHDNVMHACGHDVHMTCLLGALFVLKELEHDIDGKVKFIFQPGEEKLPGGASRLIEEGVLQNPTVDAIIGLHVQPKMQSGTIGFCSGMSMASCDEIYLKVVGKGGHAAIPDQAVDPIFVAAQIITQLPSLISKEKPPFTNSILSFGKINSLGGATNIIPDEVMIEGTLRCMDENWRERIKLRIVEMSEAICQSYGAQCKIELVHGYPSLYNDRNLTNQLIQINSDLLGNQHVVAIPPRMTSEDFAYYSHQIPACFYRLGIGRDHGVHTPYFDVDTSCLITGSASLAASALSFLKNV